MAANVAALFGSSDEDEDPIRPQAVLPENALDEEAPEAEVPEAAAPRAYEPDDDVDYRYELQAERPSGPPLYLSVPYLEPPGVLLR